MRFAIFILLFSTVAFQVEADNVDSFPVFIQSVAHGTFLSYKDMEIRGHNELDAVQFPTEREIWQIQWRGAAVTITSRGSGDYIKPYDMRVILVPDYCQWTPVKNEDGSWSFGFHSAPPHGPFLSLEKKGFERNGILARYSNSKGPEQKFWIRTAEGILGD